MRERLTLSFAALTVLLLALALIAQSWSVSDRLSTQELGQLRARVTLTGVAIAQRVESDEQVSAAFLSTLVSPTTRVSWDRPDVGAITAQGSEYADGADGTSPAVMSADLGGSELSIADASLASPRDLSHDRRTLAGLLLMGAVLAGLVGWLIASRIAAPFRQLAVAAGFLGRGRFELDLPRSRLPEVRAVSQALRGAAGRLQERLSREQDFAEHASHVLRTPLTGVRLELEELTLRDDLPGDARAIIAHTLERIVAMDVVTGELVQLSRRGSLVSGAEVSLRELATQSARRWADVLPPERKLTAAVEGDVDVTYTPGPVEHILDLLLVDVLRRGTGAVEMVFQADGTAGHLRIRLTCEGATRVGPDAASEVPISQARAVVAALGGRLSGTGPADGLEILLPRR